MGMFGNMFGFFVIIMIAISVVVAAGYTIGYALTIGEETINIKEKWVKYQGESAKYLISSTNGQVFQITDTIIKWRFDSSNLYANIDEGECYDIKTQGWRFGFFSDYKNILEVEEC